MREYTTKLSVQGKDTYKLQEEGATCDLMVVELVAVRAMWGRVFQTEIVLGTNDN